MTVQDMINQMTDPTLSVVTIFQLPHDKKKINFELFRQFSIHKWALLMEYLQGLLVRVKMILNTQRTRTVKNLGYIPTPRRLDPPTFSLGLSSDPWISYPMTRYDATFV